MRRALPILLLAVLAAALPAASATAAKQRHAPACAKPTALTFTRATGHTVGTLRWKAARSAKRFRITRNGHTLGQTRKRALRVQVQIDGGYRFAVVTLNRAGRRTRCAAAKRVHIDYRAPGAPRALAISGDERGIRLDWLPGAPGDGKPAGYRLLRGGESVGQTTHTSWKLAAAPNRSYRFTVVAVDSRGRTSAPSNAVTLDTAHTPPSTPQGLQALPVSESQIGVQWQPSSVAAGRIQGYRILRDGVVVRQVDATSDVLDNLAPSTGYGISVVAVDNLGYASAPTSTVTARTQDPVPTSGHAHAYLLATTDQSFEDFRQHYRQIGYVYPTYFDCTSDVTIEGSDDPLVTQWAQARRVKLMPRVNCQSTTRIHKILTDPATRESWLAGLRQLAAAGGYDGISLDFEAGAATDRADYSTFVEELAARLHADGRLLTIAVSAKTRDDLRHPRSGIFDVPRLEQAADWLFVMAWGLHWSTSAPGAQDDATWVSQVASYFASTPLKQKVIYGTNLYAMDWPNGGGPSNKATAYQYEDLVPHLPEMGATVQLDPTADNYHATYSDANGVPHDVWYPDATTSGRRIQLAHDRGLGGVGFWRLGAEDQRLWDNPFLAAGSAW
jgi:spore germination protein YaaH